MKIVVRGANWIGDAVMTIPALRRLRQIFDGAEITLYTRSWAEGIFRDAGFIDRIITINAGGNSAKELFREAGTLRKERFDLSILFPNSFESALVSRLANIPRRFGYSKEGRRLLLSDPIRIPEWKNDRHEIFYYLHLVAAVEKSFFGSVELNEAEPQFELDISSERKNKARNLLKNNGVDLDKKLVVFVPGSTNSRAKRWGAKNYAELSSLFQSELGIKVLLIGAADELDVSKKIAEHCDVKPVILTGQTDLSESAAILSLADLLVSNDTGPAHISAAVGAKTIVIFGPTNPKTTLPWGSEMIRVDVDCSPCMLRDCPIDHRCMTRITPEMVFEKAVSML